MNLKYSVYHAEITALQNSESDELRQIGDILYYDTDGESVSGDSLERILRLLLQFESF